jgi:hypothetical protein
MLRRQRLLIALGVLALAAGVYWLNGAVGSAREAAQRVSCCGRLRQLGLALLNYEHANGAFPTATTADGLHSWRTTLLDYCDEGQLASEIDTTIPWDSHALSPFRNSMPDIYRCYGSGQSDTKTTFYCVRAPNGIWQDRPIALEDIVDGPSKTLLLKELRLPGINWMQPTDVTLEDLIAMLERDGQLPTPHQGVVQLVFADGRHSVISNDRVTPELLRAIVTIDGGEMITEN